MLKKFNHDDNKLKYHKKIRKKILTTLAFLPQEFWDSNPIISGSYAIHLLFKPECFYDDIDFYFASSADYTLAKSILSKISEQKDSTNSNTFNTGTKKLQLINKFFAAPEKIIYAHDFKNSSICITKDFIYLDDEVFNIYYNNILSIRTTQITSDMSEDVKIKKIGLLYNRVLKYKERYELTLDETSLSILKSLQDYLNKIPNSTLGSVVVDSNIYYNGTYSPYQNSLMTMTEVKDHLKAFLFNEYSTEFSTT